MSVVFRSTGRESRAERSRNQITTRSKAKNNKITVPIIACAIGEFLDRINKVAPAAAPPYFRILALICLISRISVHIDGAATSYENSSTGVN